MHGKQRCMRATAEVCTVSPLSVKTCIIPLLLLLLFFFVRLLLLSPQSQLRAALQDSLTAKDEEITSLSLQVRPVEGGNCILLCVCLLLDMHQTRQLLCL
jgi:hypothetical protein